jgi:predicted RNase H-like nuclease (RuvC/YqgF family)
LGIQKLQQNNEDLEGLIQEKNATIANLIKEVKQLNINVRGKTKKNKRA